MKKRIISFFLAVVMLFSCLSLNIFAAGEETQQSDAEPAAGTVISDTLDAHTDAEITAAIEAIKIQGTNRNFSNGTDAGYAKGNTLKSVDGKIVKYSGETAQTRLDLSGHTVLNGRDALHNYKSSTKTHGAKLVAQATWNFTEHYKNTATGSQIIFQISDYLSTSNGAGYSSNPHILTADFTMPEIVRVDQDLQLYLNVANNSTVTVMQLETGVDYTFTVVINPKDIDEAADIYGSYDVYVNGVCVKERVKLFNKLQNASLTLDERTPYAQEDAWYTEKDGDVTVVALKDKVLKDGATVYFFSETAPTDAELLEILAKHGITVENGGTVKAEAMGRTKKGVKDLDLGFIRFHKTSEKFGEEADIPVYSIDNMIAYYVDEYVGDVTDHVLTESAHSHDFTKTTTNITYNCSFCEGKKVVVKALDANGDRVCDICVGEIPAGGILSVDDLKDTHDRVYAAENFNSGSTKQFSFGDDGTKVFKFSTGDNKYVYSVPGTKIETDSEGKETLKDTTSYLQYNHLSNTRADSIKRFNEFGGKSYVISTDIKVNPDNIASSNNLLQVLCYMSSKNDCEAIAGAVFFTPARLESNGELSYRDADQAKGTGIFLNDGEWHNIAVYHTPRGDAFSPENTYDLYVDGVCVKKNVTALSSGYDEAMTWTTEKLQVGTYGTNKFTSNGARDFIVAIARIAQHTPKLKSGSNATECIALDNAKVYYTDIFFECVHDYELSHTHKTEENLNDVSYVCKYCDKTYNVNVPMIDDDYSIFNGTGKTPTVQDAIKLVNDAWYANDFASNSFNNLLGIGSTMTGDNTEIIACKDGTLQFLATSSDSSKKAYWQIFPTAGGYSDRVTYPYNNFNELKDDSYNVTIDFRIDSKANIGAEFQLIQALTYCAFSGGPNANLSNYSAVWFSPLRVDTSGNLICFSNEARNTTKALAEGTWYTITLHYTPSGDEKSPINTYDIFVNGELLAENLIAVPTSQESLFIWETADAKSEGLQHYIPSTFRICQPYTKGSGSAVSVDNVLIYKNQDVLECKHHFTDCNVCDWCGYEVPEFEPFCEICQGVPISENVAITGRNATLGELIDMNVYAALANDKISPDTEVTITCGDKTETVLVKDALTEKGYKFSLPLRSTQMADEVTLEIDGATYTTSIADYALALIEADEKAAPVAKALLNYGAAAQTYFAVKNEDETLDDVLANAGLAEADKAVSALDAETLEKYAFVQEGATEEIHFTGAKLQLSSTTHMKLYFTAPAGATVTVNGKAVGKSFDSEEGEYYIFISGITPAAAVNGESTVVITAGDVTVTADASAFNAVVIGAAADGAIADLMNAYGQYCLAAVAYVSK